MATTTEDTSDLPEILPFDGDAYHGVQIDAAALFSLSENENKQLDPAAFGRRLRSSLGHWRAAGRRGIWLKLPLPQASALFSVAIEEGFEPHHAETDYVMMTQWLPGPPPSSSSSAAKAKETETTTAGDETETNQKIGHNNRFSKLPSYASHQVGVGAFVLNSKNEVLVVQEASGPLKGKGVWKMPTGLADAGEDVPHAAAREVLEETGLRATPTAVLAVRQAHGFAFGRSDLFFVVALRPEDEAAQAAATDSARLVPQEEEVCAARWMPLEEYCSMPWLQSRPLWSQVAKACEAHARGEYEGMPLRWLENGHNGRSDLVMCGWRSGEGGEDEEKE